MGKPQSPVLKEHPTTSSTMTLEKPLLLYIDVCVLIHLYPSKGTGDIFGQKQIQQIMRIGNQSQGKTQMQQDTSLQTTGNSRGATTQL